MSSSVMPNIFIPSLVLALFKLMFYLLFSSFKSYELSNVSILLFFSSSLIDVKSDNHTASLVVCIA